MPLPTVGRNIARLRESRGLSQVDLADKLGVRQPVVWKLEHQTGLPKLPMLFRLANALGSTLDDLVAGHDAAYDARLTKKSSGRPDVLGQNSQTAHVSPEHHADLEVHGLKALARSHAQSIDGIRAVVVLLQRIITVSDAHGEDRKTQPRRPRPTGTHRR